MIYGTTFAVIIINMVACMIFERIVAFEKRHTQNDETIGQFQKIVIMQFINIAVVILLVNFKFLNGPLLGFIPILDGEYRDFETFWYAQVGKTLCFTMLINIFSPHGSKLFFPMLKCFKRCMDRGCCNPVRKGNSDEVNTKLLDQEELNKLYTGDQISSHYVFAQNVTYLFVVLMYSTGLPIMYILASIFYFVFYWMYKGLLLKYYEKTTRFNEELPIFAHSWVQIAVVIHGIVGSFMISNYDLLPRSKNDLTDAVSSYQFESGSILGAI